MISSMIVAHKKPTVKTTRRCADNLSWNCGAEGPSDDPAVEALRNRQCKNALALLLLAVGTPMLLAGDEVRRTQHGNNNTYCQDNEIGWFDWRLVERHADIHQFVKSLVEAASSAVPWRKTARSA
jgi:glycogen operon protein